MIRTDSKIYIAGHRGLAGSAIVRKLTENGFYRLILRTPAEFDLTDQAATRAFFESERPEYVFDAAAKVGGILANSTYPATFIHENLAIQTNVIHESWRIGVKRLIFLGSTCIYPRNCPQPMKEEYLLTGPLEPTSQPYAIAKIAGIEMCWSYNRQFQTRFLAVMPASLYGPGDTYDHRRSHVLAALIRRFHEAKSDGLSSDKKVVLWGTGTPRRELLYSEDMADACIHLMNLDDDKYGPLVDDPSRPPLINIGYGEDHTISDLARLVQDIVGYQGEVYFDAANPDGMPRKLVDSSRLLGLGWRPTVTLREGIIRTYRDYLSREIHSVSIP